LPSNDTSVSFFYIYVLKSLKGKAITYVGYTKNLKNRLKLHNQGKGAKFTRGRKWKLIYKEKFSTKKKAMSREYYIKKNRKLRSSITKKFL
tara:strand:+ start:1404 stop:1676 length:273 start_codon:yes stop_codon:yes gene_type:complete